MGNMVTVRVTVKGKRRLLQHHFGPEAIPLEKGERTGVAGNDPDEWQKTCMVTKDGQLFFYGTYVFACMRNAARHTKKGRGSIQSSVAATLQVKEEIILLDRHMPEGGKPDYDRTKPVHIDVQGVRNPSTGGRNVRYRLAASEGWTCSFTLEWDKTIVPREQMRAVIRDAGNLAGLGDAVSIGFGKFDVISWEEVENAEEASAA